MPRGCSFHLLSHLPERHLLPLCCRGGCCFMPCQLPTTPHPVLSTHLCHFLFSALLFLWPFQSPINTSWFEHKMETILRSEKSFFYCLVIYSFEKYLLTPFCIQSIHTWHISRWKKHFVQSSRKKKFTNIMMWRIKKKEKKGDISQGGGKGKAWKVNTPISVVLETFWIFHNVDGQITGIFIHIALHMLLIISWTSYLSNCIVISLRVEIFPFTQLHLTPN